MHNFYCGMHLVVNMAEHASNALKLIPVASALSVQHARHLRGVVMKRKDWLSTSVGQRLAVRRVQKERSSKSEHQVYMDLSQQRDLYKHF